jgi:antibiotic biosynthesis monooxygenase (ABM) superfamily enzyme
MAALQNRAQSIVVVVLLYIRPGKGAAFRRYEDQATALIAEYGGSVQQVIAPYAAMGKINTPDEVRILSFPDQAALAAYESDPRMLALRLRRDDAIADTVMILGRPTPGT